MLDRENVLKDLTYKNYNGFSFEELSNIPKINLRGDSSDRNYITTVEKILDIIIPIEPNTVNRNNRLKILWLSPTEWLIEINKYEDYKNILSNLQKSLNSKNTAVTDVTESRTIIKLEGDHLYKLLAKFMIIDLDKNLNKELSIAQTVFIKVPIIIIRNHIEGNTPSILLYTNRSHAEYIFKILIDGSKNIDF